MSRQLLNGNEAAVAAARLARIEVMAAYPITPASGVMEGLSRHIAAGELHCNFVRVESDHSALAALIGAALCGARAFSATNSQGLALMSELLYHASGLRLPVVMAVVNRALSAPHSRFPEHGDAMAQEASGWIQLYCENNQEVLDTLLQAFYLAEDEQISLPAMVNYESYIQSHTREVVDLPAQEDVDAFLPRKSQAWLDVEHPRGINVVTGPELYMDYKYAQDEALQRALAVCEQANEAFAARFGRDWGGAVEEYRLEGAELAVIAMGSMAATARIAVDQLRNEGQKVGLLKVRLFRPFPASRILRILGGVQAALVIDRNIIYGSGGALAREVRAILGHHSSIPVYSFIAGLGGREVGVGDLVKMYHDVHQALASGKKPAPYVWYSLTG
ncbi:MAG: transketolase C-terminal domain-containing protein [Syntrophothermus sp.]